MSEQFERVEPTPFSAPEPESVTPASAAAEQSRPRWLVPALGGFAVLAIVVVFLLPGLVEAPRVDPGTAGGTGETSSRGTGQAPVAPSTGETATPSSPFADAVEAKARAAAQDVLAELLDVQEGLVERGAERWATDAMTAIAAVAQAGDELYRERRFDEALTQYEAALGDALALEQSVPERFADQLEATRAHIERFDIEAARESLDLASLLEPADPAITSLTARVTALPDVLAATETSANAEENADLEAAVNAMASAAELDAAHLWVAAELARLRGALTDERFSGAMTSGYAALQDEQFDRAQERFTAASRLRPDSPEASAALTELSVARTAATLRTLKARGERELDNEDWASAISAFEEALAVDASLRFAREGLAYAKPRAVLDSELDAILTDPGRLVDDAILREAQASLARARQLDNPGPRLQEKILQAQDTLAVASTPVPVTLLSDGLTAVTVLKVSRLGTFAQQTLNLRPGTYAAMGSRRGYRDVRREFTVTANGLASPVTIVCSEAI